MQSAGYFTTAPRQTLWKEQKSISLESRRVNKERIQGRYAYESGYVDPRRHPVRDCGESSSCETSVKLEKAVRCKAVSLVGQDPGSSCVMCVCDLRPCGSAVMRHSMEIARKKLDAEFPKLGTESPFIAIENSLWRREMASSKQGVEACQGRASV